MAPLKSKEEAAVRRPPPAIGHCLQDPPLLCFGLVITGGVMAPVRPYPAFAAAGFEARRVGGVFLAVGFGVTAVGIL